jgi:hypothetical protein
MEGSEKASPERTVISVNANIAPRHVLGSTDIVFSLPSFRMGHLCIWSPNASDFHLIYMTSSSVSGLVGDRSPCFAYDHKNC